MTDDILQRRGTSLCSQCSFCGIHGETLIHLFCYCNLIKSFCGWLASFFRVQLLPDTSPLDLLSQEFIGNMASSTRLLWCFAFCNALWCLWTERNKIRYDNASFEALQIAWAKMWTHIWLERDSSLVVHYFKNPLIIPGRQQSLEKLLIFGSSNTV